MSALDLLALVRTGHGFRRLDWTRRHTVQDSHEATHSGQPSQQVRCLPGHRFYLPFWLVCQSHVICLYPTVSSTYWGRDHLPPPKCSHGLSPDTVLTTCNNSLQPPSGPRNQALLLSPFYRAKAQGTSLVSVAGSVWWQKGPKRARGRMGPLVPVSAVTSCMRLNLLEYLCEVAIPSTPAYPPCAA